MVCKKIIKWLPSEDVFLMQLMADKAEGQAKKTRSLTMKEVWEAFTKTYRAIAKDMEQAIAKWEKNK